MAKIVHIPKWAESAQRHSIELHHSLDVQLMRKCNPLLFIGGVHGDEPEGVALADATLHWLKTTEVKISTPWILIPCLNPDGYRSNNRVNGNGVDLNRNYPAQGWRAEASQPRYNPGPHAASEPEIKALVQLIETVCPSLIIHCHSWHPCIVCTGKQGLKDAQILAQVSGYKLQDNIGYDTPGSLSQYAAHDQKIPVICIEEQEGTPISAVWPHFAKAIEQIFTRER